MAFTEAAPRATRGRKRVLLDDPSDAVGAPGPTNNAASVSAPPGKRARLTSSLDSGAGSAPPSMAESAAVPAMPLSASVESRSRGSPVVSQAGLMPSSSGVPVFMPRTPSKTRVSQSQASPSLPHPSPSPSRTASASSPSKHARRSRPTACIERPEDLYPMYRDLVAEHTVVFVQLQRRRWACQIYDPEKCVTVEGVHGWATVSANVSADGSSTHACSCPDFKLRVDCVHVRMVVDSSCPAWVVLEEQYAHPYIPLEGRCDDRTGHPSWTFACTSAVEPPVFVQHIGVGLDDGSWCCSKDRGARCHHIARLKRHLRRALEEESELAQEAEEREEEALVERELLQTERDRVEDSSAATRESERSISWLPVGPPLWCRLKTDTAPSFAPPRSIPEILALSPHPGCACGWRGRAEVSKRRRCVVYGSRSATAAEIEVAACPACNRRGAYAGPDLRELGLFNFNNSSIYTHELLNAFTSRITAHELPFHAFVTAVSRDYTENQSPIAFVSDDTFRKAWFSFSHVQTLGDSFKCDICGSRPRCIIFDGVTAGFDASQLTSSLCPPTKILPGAPVRNQVRPAIEALSAVWGACRVRAQRAVRWRLGLTKANASALGGIDTLDDDVRVVDVPDADTNEALAAKATHARISKRDAADEAMRSSLPAIAAELLRLDTALGTLFRTHVTAHYASGEEGRRLYLELLNQVLAYESVLHLAPASSWPALQLLEGNDKLACDVLLREVPAFGLVAALEWAKCGAFSTTLRGLATFVRRRAIRVFSSLSDHAVESPLPGSADDNWQETGTYYGNPPVRLRPEYPNLPGDKKVDRAVITEDGGGGIGCSKYYEAYGRRGQTGGLMAAWCSHSVCLGFHCIPRGEGRNDVFSALFTRWEEPPEVVVYDFACALAHYCMLREPRYFKNTRFVIDGFHAKGHTRCTKACFISNYKNDALLSGVNSSAAECGNRGLLKIRRPLSYMSQRRAIIYTYTYLATWNRERRLAAEAKLTVA